jgi:uncharacterized damage-inducible protein DinB
MARTTFKPVLLRILHEAHLAQDAFLQELDSSERAAVGTPNHWSVKDHVAHMAYWRGRLVLKLQAVLVHETPPDFEDFQRLNVQVFKDNLNRAWREVLFDSEQTYEALIVNIRRLTDEDLVAFNRFDWAPDGQPLHALIMGSSYEHAQQHLAQFYLDRGDLASATRIHEGWVSRVVRAKAPTAMKGLSLYNLACFYAMHAQLEKAKPVLEQALTLYPGPRLREWSRRDPELIALRDQPSQVMGSFGDSLVALAVLPDSAMAAPWTWRPGGEVLEVRDALHRSLEAERAQLARTGSVGPWSEPEIAMIEADRALGDLLGLLAGQPDEILDVEHAPGEWSLREVLHHTLVTELSFASNTRWAVTRRGADPVLTPEELLDSESEASAEGTISDLAARLQSARDATDDLVEKLAPAQLELPTFWAGHSVDVRFRLHRFASHFTEHAVQVEKVLHALGDDPAEARQLVRATSAARGAHRRRSSPTHLRRLDIGLAERASQVTRQGPP